MSGNSDAGIVCLAQHAPHTVGRWPLEQPQAFHNQRPQAIAATWPPTTTTTSTATITTTTCYLKASSLTSRRPQVQQPLYMIINDKKLVMQKIDMVNDKEQVR